MKKRIMLAENDESVRKMVTRVLESAGYDVTQTRNCQEAVARLHACRPDLALVDLPTPNSEGWAAIESVAHLAPLMPVVALTTWPAGPERANSSGIGAVLEKPLDLLLLLQTIRESLVKSEMRRAAGSAEARCQPSLP